MNRWTAAAPVAILLIFVLVGAAQLRGGASDRFVGAPARSAPELVLPTLRGGEAVYPGDVDAGPRLVNFWATWCAPCAVEHPLLIEMAAAGAVIDGVLYKDDADAARAALAATGDPFDRVPLDPSGDAGLSFGLAGVPETFLIDAQGQLIKTHRGPLDAKTAADFMAAFEAAKETEG